MLNITSLFILKDTLQLSLFAAEPSLAFWQGAHFPGTWKLAQNTSVDGQRTSGESF